MRQSVVVLLLAVPSLCGCLSRQPGLLRSGEDPKQLAAVIAQRGEGKLPAEPEPLPAHPLGPKIRTAARISEGCLKAAFVGALIVATAAGRGGTLPIPEPGYWASWLD